MPAVESLPLRIPPDVKRWLEDYAEREGTSINKLAVAIFEEHDDSRSNSDPSILAVEEARRAHFQE